MLSLLKNLKEKGDWRTLLFHSSWALTLTSGLSYFFGLLRDRIFAHTFGLSRTLDIYNASFVIPDLMMNVLVSTALSAAFIPIFTQRYDQDRKLGYQYAHQVISWGALVIISCGILVALTLPWYAHRLVPGFSDEEVKQYILLARITLLSPLIFTFSNVYGRILMGLRDFLWYGLSSALYNIGIVVGTLLFAPKFGVVGLMVATVFGAALHLGIRLIILSLPRYRYSHRIDFRLSPEIRETVWLTAPKMVQYFMWNLMLLNFTRIASNMVEGSVAAYNYARNFQSLPVSMLGIAIATAMFTSLSHDAAKGKFEKFRRDMKRDRTRILFYTITAAVAMALLARPMISLLLGGGRFGEESVNLLTSTLQVYCLSVPLESLLHFYHRSYYSLKNTVIPSVFHALTILLIILLAYQMTPRLGVLAIPAAFAAGLAVHISILAIIFPFLLRRREASFVG